MKISANVIKGLGQAKKFEFPTLNISPRSAPRALKPGVYAARVKTSAGIFFSVAYFGPRFEPPQARAADGAHIIAPRTGRVLEVHCFGISKMPPVKRLTLEFVKRLRAPKKFSTTAALKKQIARDITQAKKNLKNAIILHGAGCTPKLFWYSYIKRALQNRGYQVWLPQLPEANHPRLKKWLPFVLKNAFFSPETIIIAHSAGCPLTLALLERIPVKIKKSILVAGYIKPLKVGANDMLQRRYRWDKIKAHTDKLIAINSDNDPWGCGPAHGRSVARATEGKFILLRGQAHMGSTKFPQPYKKFPLLRKLAA